MSPYKIILKPQYIDVQYMEDCKFTTAACTRVKLVCYRQLKQLGRIKSNTGDVHKTGTK